MWTIFCKYFEIAKILLNHYLKCVKCWYCFPRRTRVRNFPFRPIAKKYFAIYEQKNLYYLFIGITFWRIASWGNQKMHINIISSTSIVFDDRFLKKLMLINKKMFLTPVRLYVCGVYLPFPLSCDVYVFVRDSVHTRAHAHTLPVINNANDFRQRRRGNNAEEMQKRGCVNKIQKNCSISRLRIAYLPRRGSRFFNNTHLARHQAVRSAESWTMRQKLTNNSGWMIISLLCQHSFAARSLHIFNINTLHLHFVIQR